MSPPPLELGSMLIPTQIIPAVFVSTLYQYPAPVINTLEAAEETVLTSAYALMNFVGEADTSH